MLRLIWVQGGVRRASVTMRLRSATVWLLAAHRPAPENNRRALRVETCDSVGDDVVTPQPWSAQRTEMAAETANVVGEGGGPYGRTMFRRAPTSMLDLVRLHHAPRRVRSVFGRATTMLR